jgi:hypothetical protein
MKSNSYGSVSKIIKLNSTFCIFHRVSGLLGYQPQDLLNKTVYDFYHPEDQAHMKDTFDQGKLLYLLLCVSLS